MNASPKYDYEYIKQLHDEALKIKGKRMTQNNTVNSKGGEKKKRDRFCPTPCPFCDIVLTRKDGLPRHVQSKHPEFYNDWRNNRSVMADASNMAHGNSGKLNKSNSDYFNSSSEYMNSSSDMISMDDENDENDIVIVDLPLEVNLTASPNKYPAKRSSPTACPYCGLVLSRKDSVKPHVLSLHPGLPLPDLINGKKAETKSVKVKCSTRFIPSPVPIDKLKREAELNENVASNKKKNGRSVEPVKKSNVVVRSEFTPVLNKKTSKPIPPLTPIGLNGIGNSKVKQSSDKKGSPVVKSKGGSKENSAESPQSTPVLTPRVGNKYTPTPCPYCGQVLSRRDSVKPHILAKHPGCDIPPEICSNSTPTEKQSERAKVAEKAMKAKEDKKKSKAKENNSNKKKKSDHYLIVDEPEEDTIEIDDAGLGLEYVEVDYDEYVESDVMPIQITEMVEYDEDEECYPESGEIDFDIVEDDSSMVCDENSSIVEITSARQPIQCPFCDRVLSRKENFVNHMTSKHPDKHCEIRNLNVDLNKSITSPKKESPVKVVQLPDPSTGSGSVKRDRIPVQCPYCEVIITRYSNLKGHIKSKHKDEPLPEFEDVIYRQENEVSFQENSNLSVTKEKSVVKKEEVKVKKEDVPAKKVEASSKKKETVVKKEIKQEKVEEEEEGVAQSRQDWDRVWQNGSSVHVKFNFSKSKSKSASRLRNESESSCSVESLDGTTLDSQHSVDSQHESKSVNSDNSSKPSKSKSFKSSNTEVKSEVKQEVERRGRSIKREEKSKPSSLKLTRSALATPEKKAGLSPNSPRLEALTNPFLMNLKRRSEKPVLDRKVPSPGTPGIIDLHRQSMESVSSDTQPGTPGTPPRPASPPTKRIKILQSIQYK